MSRIVTAVKMYYVALSNSPRFAPSLRKCGLQKYIITDAYGDDAGIIDYARRLIS